MISVNYRKIVFIILFLSFLLLYIWTISPNWGASNIFNTWDGLEYLLCSQLGGIDHPPGHPFYLLLSRLFRSIFTIGSQAYRMNLFSATFGASAVSFIYLVVELALRLIIGSKSPVILNGIAIIIATTFGVSKVFWTHSLITEVHTLYLFLMALLFYSTLKYLKEKNRIWIYTGSFLSGLLISTSILNALTILFPVFVFLFCVKFNSLKIKNWLFGVFLFLGGLLFYLYYPIVSKINPGFVHPMNLITSQKPGSLSWFIWFISGKSWTEGGMFSFSRVFLNIPNFAIHIINNFSLFSFVVFIFTIIFGFKKIYSYVYTSFKYKLDIRKLIANSTYDIKIFSLFFFTFIVVAIPQLALQDISNPGSTTFIYVANFFLPSFMIYIFIVSIGFGIIFNFLIQEAFLKKFLKIFSLQKLFDGSASGIATFILLCFLLILPLHLLVINYHFCNLRGESGVYQLAKGIIRTLPPHSVIYSKLVYEQVCTYFLKLEPVLKDKDIKIENPDIISKEIKAVDISTIIEKTNILKRSIKENLKKNKSVYISGDCIEEDKAPEILLISDLKLEPTLPHQTMTTSIKRPFPSELIPYKVVEFRKGVAFSGNPEIEYRGIANDGNFSNILKLLGYNIPKENLETLGRKKISLDFYWKVLDKVPEDILGEFIVLDENYRIIGTQSAFGLFTLGGTYKSSMWKNREIIKERVYYYLPTLPFGRYYMALKLLKSSGETIQYYPASFKNYGQKFDFVLLLPLTIGP